jgi:hypothetical protein
MWDFNTQRKARRTTPAASSMPMIESLEGRQLFSASAVSFESPTPAPQATAIVVEQTPTAQSKAEQKAAKLTARAEAKAAKLAAKVEAQAAKAEAKALKLTARELAKAEKQAEREAKKVNADDLDDSNTNPAIFDKQDLFGQWEGTFRSAKTVTTTTPDPAFSVEFTIRWPGNTNVMSQAFTGTFDLSAMNGESAAISTMTMSLNHDVRILVKTASSVTSFNGALSYNGEQIVGRYTVLTNGQYEVGSFVLNRK